MRRIFIYIYIHLNHENFWAHGNGESNTALHQLALPTAKAHLSSDREEFACAMRPEFLGTKICFGKAPCASKSCTPFPVSDEKSPSARSNNLQKYLTNKTLDRRGGVAPLSWGGWGGVGMLTLGIPPLNGRGRSSIFTLLHSLHMNTSSLPRNTSRCYATWWTASVHTLDMSKPNVTRVQSATEWTAWVHTLHMSKPNVTRVQSVTEWTASEHTLHMSKPNVTGFAFLQLLLLSTKHGCSPNKTCASRKKRARVVVCFQMFLWS